MGKPEFRVYFASGLSVFALAETPEEAIDQACIALSSPEAIGPVTAVDELVPFGSPRRVVDLFANTFPRPR